MKNISANEQTIINNYMIGMFGLFYWESVAAGCYEFKGKWTRKMLFNQ